jgi:hypothetical protein
VSRRRAQAGFLSIVALLLMIVLVSMAIALGYLVAGGALATASRAGAMQALFLAESGLEVEQRRWAQNLNWYRSASDPNPAAPATQALGSGTFTVSTSLPATLLRVRLTAAGNTIVAYTTNRFPTSGILQIDDDLASGGELVRYTGIAGNTFTGVTRAQSVGTVTSLASAHQRSSVVYPVTILRTAMAANCTPLASIQVDAHGKFLGAGTLDIEGEEVAYGGSSTSGGITTLTGIRRCQGSVASVAHAIGQPVTPVLQGGDSASYQVELAASGTSGAATRHARRTIAR